jgi:hypothetical protein
MTSEHIDGEGGVYTAMVWAGVLELLAFAVIYCGYAWITS